MRERRYPKTVFEIVTKLNQSTNGKLKLYLCRENIDFFEDFKYVNESTDEHS